METVTPAEFKNLDTLGEDLALQVEFRTIIAAIAEDSSLVAHYEWSAKADRVTKSAGRFLKEMDAAHPIYSVFPEAVAITFVSPKDANVWDFALTKGAFIYIREILASQKG